MKTIGVSPKVLTPAVVLALVGVVLLALGFDVEGRTLIGAAVGGGALGAAARPGNVVRDVDKAAGDVAYVDGGGA